MITIHHNIYLPHEVEAKTSSHMIDVFYEWTGKRAISLNSDSKLSYLFIVTGETKIELSLGTLWATTAIDVWWLCLATPWSDIEVKIKATLGHDVCTTNMHIVSFLMEGGKCNVDGWLSMEKWIHQGVWHLLEENILLGNNIQLRTLPMLDVQSNDVQASHGATIQRLDEEKLFYLTSKWIPLSEAKSLMITSYFDTLFESFGEEKIVTELKEQYLQKILSNL